MHRFKLMGLALLAVLAFASVAAATASAEAPLVLVLPGEKAAELEYKGTGGEATLSDINGKTIIATKVKAAATFTAVAGKEADAELGKATLDFEGAKKEKVACRSENAKAEKDPVETILVVTGLITENEETTGKALQGALVNLLTETLLINCGGVKEEVKGSVPCLVTPVLTEVAVGGTVEIKCAQEKGKQLTGKCLESKAACEDLTKNPFLANLGGGFVEAGEGVTVAGTFNKMVTLDD
jgi:hypothetical protein